MFHRSWWNWRLFSLSFLPSQWFLRQETYNLGVLVKSILVSVSLSGSLEVFPIPYACVFEKLSPEPPAQLESVLFLGRFHYFIPCLVPLGGLWNSSSSGISLNGCRFPFSQLFHFNMFVILPVCSWALGPSLLFSFNKCRFTLAVVGGLLSPPVSLLMPTHSTAVSRPFLLAAPHSPVIRPPGCLVDCKVNLPPMPHAQKDSGVFFKTASVSPS